MSVHREGCLLGGVSVPGGCLVRGGGAWSGGGVPALGGMPARGGCLVDPPDGYCCGRYVSYWNAFLFNVFLRHWSLGTGTFCHVHVSFFSESL